VSVRGNLKKAMNIKLNSLIILIFQAIHIFGFSQENPKTEYFYDKTSKLNLNLNGQVKYVNEITENLKIDSNEEREFFFDKNGKPTKIIVLSLGLDVMARKLRNEKTIFAFDNGKLVSELNQTGEGLDGYTYKFDGEKNLTQKRYYVQNRVVSEEIFEYDEYNRKIKFIKYVFGFFRDYSEEIPPNKDDFIQDYKTYEYNELGNLTVENTHTNKLDIYEKTLYTYDVNGNKIEEGNCKPHIERYSKEKKCDYRPVFGWKYDDKNQMIKSFQLADFNPHNTDTYYKYDNQGRKIESKGYYIYKSTVVPILGYHFNYVYDDFGNKIKDEEVFGKYRRLGFDRYKTESKEFDEFQNIILEEFITKDDERIKVIKYVYSYDVHGNWIERQKLEGKTSADLELIEIKQRKIEYYN
jgi:hypothetical protein